MANFKNLRESLSTDDICGILRKYGVEPSFIRDKYIIFPTCCHNVDCGSPKLYYYPETHLFHCYTDCSATFDIFDLIIKMEKLRGRKIGKINAIQITGLQITSADVTELAEESFLCDISHLFELNRTKPINTDDIKLEPLDIKFLDSRFAFDLSALKIWTDEGIGIESMLKYRITYDPIDNCIIIPQFDAKGNVVGVRGRYLDEDVTKDKYRPIVFNGKLLSHPIAKTLYGYYQNKDAIKQTRTAVIFEAEKSVLKMDTCYGSKNISVATCGQHISREQIQLLVDLGVSNVILAFDADYRTGNEMNEVYLKYKEIAEPLKTFFCVSLVFDTEDLLGYKDSPIDKGIDVFRELMAKRKVI